MGEVGKRLQGAGEVLPERITEPVRLAGAVPDELLVGAGEDAHGGSCGAVAGDLPVVVPIGCRHTFSRQHMAGTEERYGTYENARNPSCSPWAAESRERRSHRAAIHPRTAEVAPHGGRWKTADDSVEWVLLASNTGRDALCGGVPSRRRWPSVAQAAPGVVAGREQGAEGHQLPAVRVLIAAVAAAGILAFSACEKAADTSDREWEDVQRTVAWGRVDDARVLLFSWHEGRRVTQGGSLYTVREDGTGLAALRPPTPDSYDHSPLVSPDGTRIAYSAALDGSKVRHSELVTADLDGTDHLRLTHDDTGQHAPAWSPDGTRLAFSARNNLQTMAVDGSDTRTIARGLSLWGEPVWSPDGTRVAVRATAVGETYGEPDLYIVAADGSRLDQVAESAGQPQWSPDGRRIAYAREIDRYLKALDVLNLDDGAATPVIAMGRFDAFAWSRDGSEIFVGFYYSAIGPDVLSERGLFAISADGEGKARRVAPGSAVRALAWSADGTRLAVLTDPSLALAGDIDALVYTVAADGSDLRVVVRAGPAGPLEASAEGQAAPSADGRSP